VLSIALEWVSVCLGALFWGTWRDALLSGHLR
jgi:hypothetical protein